MNCRNSLKLFTLLISTAILTTYLSPPLVDEQFVGCNSSLRHNIAKRAAAKPVVAIQNIEMCQLMLGIFNRKVWIDGSAAMQATQCPFENFLVFLIMPLRHRIKIIDAERKTIQGIDQ